MISYSKSLSTFTVSFLCCLFLLSACESSEESKSRHIRNAKEFLAEENYDKARVELKNVLQIDPKSAEAYNLLGKVEKGNKNWRKAIVSYYHAIELAPEMLDPHIKLGRFFLKQAAIAKAGNKIGIEQEYLTNVKAQVDAATQINPLHIDSIVLKASFTAYQGLIDEAIALLQKTINTNSANSDSILLLSRLYIRKELDADAEKLLKDGIVLLPSDIGLHIELAKYYENRKQFEDASKVMREIIKLDPMALTHRQTLAYYYLRQDDPEKAEKVYQQAIKDQQDDAIWYFAYADFIKQQKSLRAAINFLENNVENDSIPNKELSFKLASLYQEAGDVDKAIVLLNKIVESENLDLSGMRARKELMPIYLSLEDVKSTKRLIEEVLAENPNDYDAILLKGKISAQEKNYELAITLFRTALKSQPDSIKTLHLLAEAHLLNGETHIADDLLKRAIEINRDDKNSHLRFARFLLASNRDVQALEQVNRVLQDKPNDIDAILLKSDILMHQDKLQELISLLDRLKELAPENAEAWFRMGRVYKQVNSNDRARQEFISAFNKAPDSVDLLAELTDIEIELGEISSSKVRLQKILTEQQDHSAAHKFLAMVYLAEKNSVSAENEFILHLQQSPEDVTAYIQLANIQISRKNINQAADYYLKARTLDPDNIDILMNLAKIRLIQKKYDYAIALYDEVLNIQPDNAVATNNLAMILVNNKSDPDSLQRAKNLILSSQSKNHPALLDTLGWIYFHLGEYNNAHSALDKAIAQAPNIPTFLYHKGVVFLKVGDKDIARKYLLEALSLGIFPERADAESVLDRIKGS